MSAATAGAIMLNGRGNAQNIVCPLHRWTYDLKGELLGAPHFEQQPCHLKRSPCRTGTDCCSRASATCAPTARTGVSEDLNFDGYMLDHVEIHDCDYNWKTFIGVYTEDYHVVPFHQA